MESEEYKMLLGEVKMFLVEAVSNVVSAAFNFLEENKLGEK